MKALCSFCQAPLIVDEWRNRESSEAKLVDVVLYKPCLCMVEHINTQIKMYLDGRIEEATKFIKGEK